jgi:SAM-dependent methyltransferase
MNDHRKIIEQLLSTAGVRIDGPDPWDIQVRDEGFYARVLKDGSLGLGESYMESWWDCARIDEFICRILRAQLEQEIKPGWPLLLRAVVSRTFNQQSRRRAFVIADRHYDIGNDLFALMLGKSMSYTCGYWLRAADLDAAQEAKIDLICRKLGLRAGMTVLDIGCGYGGFMKYAAEKYGITATGVTVSREQADPPVILIDEGQKLFFYRGISILLRPASFSYVLILAQTPGQFVMRERIYRHLWPGEMNYEGSNQPYERQITDHKRRLIAEIRKGITGRVEIREGEMEALIATRHRMGYMLNFSREHVLILGKTDLLAFAWLIPWDPDSFLGRMFFDTPGVFLCW